MAESKIEELNHWRMVNLPVQKLTSYDEWLENWKEGMELLEEKQWSHAKQSF